MASFALLASLEEAGRCLVSEQFVRLVDASQWNNVRTSSTRLRQSWGNIEQLADEWSAAHEGQGASQGMTIERACDVMGLSRKCTPEELKTRWRNLSKAFRRGEGTADPETQERNKCKMQEINAAHEVLLKAIL